MRPLQPFKYNLVWAVWEHLMILSKILSQNVESNHCLGFYCNNPNLNKVRELIKNMCFLKYFFPFSVQSVHSHFLKMLKNLLFFASFHKIQNLIYKDIESLNCDDACCTKIHPVWFLSPLEAHRTSVEWTVHGHRDIRINSF